MGIKYLSIYETAVHAHDLKSGKPVTNLFYHRCNEQVVAPPAFGADIAGPSSIATWITNFRLVFRQRLLPFMSTHYQVSDYTCKQITGWSTDGTPRPIPLAENTNPAIIHTTGPHNLPNGAPVTIGGATGNTAVNGSWIITYISPTSFSVPVAGNGNYTGGGVWQLTVVPPHLTYGDTSILPGVVGTDEGSEGGDAVPLFSSISVFKRGLAAGRNFRGRNSMSPTSENITLNGRLTDAGLTLVQTNWNDFLSDVNRLNGGTDAGSKFMFEYVFSKTKALQQAPVFTESATYASLVVSATVRPNLGSIVRRKPRLNSVILT